ncbi:MAG TPA: hypothetical protein VFG20_13165, partial [Planctomycetaceae bacterium]|nr:hypothetical protein [Planctomycetaceae bacterium]
VFSNLALVFGFAVLAMSHFIPLVYFGVLVSLAMIGGLVGNLVLLPLLLHWIPIKVEHPVGQAVPGTSPPQIEPTEKKSGTA